MGSSPSERPPLIVIAGPTATGKTALSIRLAEAIAGEGMRAEILSADSRQVYRGLDIGTAKATPEERARIPHHGLDLVDPDVRFTVADFTRHTAEVLATIAESGGTAILVGGTGLYLRAVARGLDTEALPSDVTLRARLDAELLEDGLPELVSRLRALAPGIAARTDLANPRRVVRALEIAELAGDVAPPALRGYPGPVAWLGLDVGRATHARWIGRRARSQFERGLVDEAAALRRTWDPALPAFSAIGYREAWAVLDERIDIETAIARDRDRNLAFAKRQRTWFRSEPGITWLDPSVGDPLPSVLDRARRLLEAASPRVPGPAR
jgi:tRNA dimethylallyltransferase